jgi:threonine aldolase
MPIDLRSDTVTRPSAAMRQAMAAAEVGDDVFQDDPTLNRLEHELAKLLGKEAALYVPSGTMSNQLCLRAHSQPGESVIAHSDAHILIYETGAPCAISGLQPRTIATKSGTFTPEQVAAMVTPVNIHHSRNRILELENTHNRCGGAVWPMDLFKDVCAEGHRHGLKVHLDGARLWNACAATGTQPADWAMHVDSISVCFSKGLGAPIGSALAGSREFVENCRFYRKMFGGQMRQAGILAAAVLYALENNRERVVEDHDNARLFAELAAQSPHLTCIPPQSNIVMVDVEDGVAAADLAQLLNDDYQVWAIAIGPQRIRAVTHLDVTRDQCEEAGKAFAAAAENLFAGSGATA